MGELLLLEPVGGVADDMFLAAALDLGLDRAALTGALASLGLPFRLEATRAEVGGIVGLHVEVIADGPQPAHRTLPEILALVRGSGLSQRASEAAAAVFERIGWAEARVHCLALDEVHFHEAGALDSIVDVCGAAVALELLGWPRLVSLPPELGQGLIETAHGRLPVPRPAVLEILAGKPVRMGGPPGEAVTPTGAALLAVLAEVGAQPAFRPRRTGYGVGTSRWPDRPNVLRMILGEEFPSTSASVPGQVPMEVRRGIVQLEANLDDCPGQFVARAIEAALEAGAVDAWAAPATMKKGRPALILAALAPEERREAVARTFFAETTTLGVRFFPVERVELAREFVTVDTIHGRVRVKVGRLGGEVIVAHPEYDDCLARARERGTAVKEVMAAADAAWREGRDP